MASLKGTGRPGFKGVLWMKQYKAVIMSLYGTSSSSTRTLEREAAAVPWKQIATEFEIERLARPTCK